MGQIGFTSDFGFNRPAAFSRTVTTLSPGRRIAVDLNKHGVVNLRTKGPKEKEEEEQPEEGEGKEGQSELKKAD